MIARTKRVFGRALGFSRALLIVGLVAGCGGSGTPTEVAPEARKALDRRKIDAVPKAPKGSRGASTSSPR